MSESLKISNQEQDPKVEPNEYPSFNPDEAKRIKEIGSEAKLAVSPDEAREMGKMNLRSSKEMEVKANEILSQGLTDGGMSVRSDLSPEQKIEANRDMYADIQKRLAYISELYPAVAENRNWDDPELTMVPDSIRREYRDGSRVCELLLDSATGNVQGRGDLELPDGTLMPAYRRNEDVVTLLNYGEARRVNDNIFDQEALANYAAPQLDVEQVEARLSDTINRIRGTNNLEELSAISQSEASKADLLPGDIETALQIRALKIDDKINQELFNQRANGSAAEKPLGSEVVEEIVEPIAKLRAEDSAPQSSERFSGIENIVNRIKDKINGFLQARQRVKEDSERARRNIEALSRPSMKNTIPGPREEVAFANEYMQKAYDKIQRGNNLTSEDILSMTVSDGLNYDAGAARSFLEEAGVATGKNFDVQLPAYLEYSDGQIEKLPLSVSFENEQGDFTRIDIFEDADLSGGDRQMQMTMFTGAREDGADVGYHGDIAIKPMEEREIRYFRAE